MSKNQLFTHIQGDKKTQSRRRLDLFPPRHTLDASGSKSCRDKIEFNLQSQMCVERPENIRGPRSAGSLTYIDPGEASTVPTKICSKAFTHQMFLPSRILWGQILDWMGPWRENAKFFPKCRRKTKLRMVEPTRLPAQLIRLGSPRPLRNLPFD
jgi:hypothetical protein